MFKGLLFRLALSVPVWLMLGGMSWAMCMWFVPPSRQFSQAINMKTLLLQDGENVTITVQPQFGGDATSFALVMPFPSQPTVKAAPEDIFTQLEDLTNPVNSFNDVIALDLAEGATVAGKPKGVEIIERRDVGDYSTVTLSADSESSLTNWLDEQGYEITETKKATIADYIHKGGYFVALKVNVKKANVDKDGFLQGELKPISFTFKSSDPMLPTRLLAGEKSVLTLTIYSLSDALTYIPGAEVQYSKKVTSTNLKDYPALESYGAWQKWLVRNVIQLDPSELKMDLSLNTTTDNIIVVPGEQPVVLNPQLLAAGTGVIVSDNGQLVYTKEKDLSPSVVTIKSNNVTNAMVIILAISNIILLSLLISRHNLNDSDRTKS